MYRKKQYKAYGEHFFYEEKYIIVRFLAAFTWVALVILIHVLSMILYR